MNGKDAQDRANKRLYAIQRSPSIWADFLSFVWLAVRGSLSATESLVELGGIELLTS